MWTPRATARAFAAAKSSARTAPFPLGERQLLVQLAGRVGLRRVDAVDGQHEAARLVDLLQGLDAADERAGEPVDAVDDDAAERARLDVSDQPLELRPLHRAAGLVEIPDDLDDLQPAGLAVGADRVLLRVRWTGTSRRCGLRRG